MRLTQRTDLALRALLYLACECDSLCSVSDMAAVLDVSFSHLQKAMRALAKAGFVETRRGKGGGHRLARAPADISVADVIRAIEPMEPVECWRDDNRCVLTPSCALIGLIDQGIEAFLNSLDVPLSTISDTPMRRRLMQLGIAARAQRP